MSDKTFKINPCQACKNKYDVHDINNINQCCYDTLGAFEGGYGLNSFRNNPEAENCKKCVLESISSLGRTPCDFRLTAYPAWLQAPHYFPAFLGEEGDVGKAKYKCIEACKSSTYPNECIANCNLDADAVVENYAFNQKQYGSKLKDQNEIQKLLSNDTAYLSVVLVWLLIGSIIFTLLFTLFIPKK